jgi:hypothetical protein
VPALALLALPFRPVTAGDFTSSLSTRRSASASCQAHMNYPAASSGVSVMESLFQINAASGGVLNPGYAIISIIQKGKLIIFLFIKLFLETLYNPGRKIRR